MSTTTSERVRNGVDTQQLFGTLDLVKEQPKLAQFQFRATNRWIGGAHNRTTIQEFYGAGQVDTSRAEPFVIDAGEPAVLVGTDTGANPAEHLLHALAACVTTSLVYVAAARGVRLTEVESTLEGDIDLNGALGTDTSYRNGFERIRMTFRVRGDAPPEKLREIVARGHGRSVVFDSITRGVPVTVDVVTD
ncbi:MAG TPA: OsmC family protein [Miltoncostaeaceae bacterium]|nr:OsmC family protein [Miltoncostaeaceae bacterium]